MKFDLTTPCNLCPFRNDDKRLTVSADRLQEFADNPVFVCHKTAECRETEDEDSSGFMPKENGLTRACAGFLIFHEKQKHQTQAMQLAERFGLYDYRKLNMEAPVFGSIDEVKKADKKRKRY